MDTKRFKPVRLDAKTELARAMQQPGFKAAWDALEEEYSAINQQLRATKPPRRLNRVGWLAAARRDPNPPTPLC